MSVEDNTVCFCKQVSEATIVEAMRSGAHSLEAIKKATGACTGSRCKELNPNGHCCSSDIRSLLHRTTGTTFRESHCCCDGN